MKKKKVSLRRTLFLLPSLFTLSSIFCGFYATLLCLREPGPDAYYRASLLIVFAMFFDMIDGRVARLTKTQSAFGVQIDSLADVISFGVAPAVLLYQWSLHGLGFAGLLGAFAFVACGAIRLARFNVLATGDAGAPKKPSKYIVGLPIPGAAGVLVSIVVANHAIAGSLQRASSGMLAVVLGLAFFMVSTIKFRSFKDLALNGRTLLLVAFAVGSSAVVALAIHPSFALVWLLACYLAIGVAESLFNLSRRGLRRARADGDEDDSMDDGDEPAELDA
ncbi:MAG TPA: CDP-diacylglycerol--serine O-phosphatidyltransferase [Sandaracinaceae bacterium LLY-WYZ-13_1]|nr:CDP-diacylglycerol--serine O-phosphatidyltransferase [Sandaracinaceae bacterium LLY-WYZ-13_1]